MGFARSQNVRFEPPGTKGRFQLNVRIQIAFDGQSQMEVDFVNDALRIVIELDGAQLLSDAEAYRRDRPTDRLLQQSGYLVLRFLAEDVGKDLDGVWDSILQPLVGREQSGDLIPQTFPPSFAEILGVKRNGAEEFPRIQLKCTLTNVAQRGSRSSANSPTAS